ncbi:MAG: NERD domain-containing protein [Undibacterium sp.]|nr:NERD domain-containing protein [Opitutaceae bacterium]
MPDKPLNRTEALVLDVCQRSFLSLWCHGNPRAADQKELCDLLVVCGPHTVIVSVKEIHLKATADPADGLARWERKAVDASVRQIYGAERALAGITEVIRRDGTPGLTLPPLGLRKIHRLAVAFGDKGEVAIKSGDFNKGFVHVMSEPSFHDVLAELDTISDFVAYLVAKENFAGRCRMICEGSESNVLGWYLTHERTFPENADVMLFDDTIWAGLQNETTFKRRKEADRDSYIWDRLIEGLADPSAKSVEGPGPTLNELEFALRRMALETRFHRRILGHGVGEFLTAARARQLASRILAAPSGVIYVLVYFPEKARPEDRRAEVTGRCFIARQRLGQGTIAVGVGLSDHVRGIGSASDLVYLDFSKWSEADERAATDLKAKASFFANARTWHRHDDEYPTQ